MKTATPLILAAAVTAALATPASAPARADNRSTTCQTIGGQAICATTSRRNGLSLFCRSDDGHILCLGTGGLRCESTAGAPLSCRSGDPSITVKVFPAPAASPRADDRDDEE
jgi:putative hemolysin